MISYVLFFLQIVCSLALLLSVVMLHRNRKVYEFRMHLLGRVSDAAKWDIKHGADYTWRYQVLDSVQYGEMVVKFWRPLTIKKWYGDSKFTTIDIDKPVVSPIQVVH